MGLSAAAFCAPFGLLEESGGESSVSYKDRYLIDKIAEGRPVSFCVDGRLDKYSLSKEQFESALNSWFKYAYQQIVQAKRQREFQDLLPVLSKGAEIRIQNCARNAYFQRHFAAFIQQGSGAPGYEYASSEEDLRIILVEEEEVGSQAHTESPRYIFWNMEDRDGADGLDTLRHELGHILSLADQYQRGRVTISAYGTSDIVPSMMNEADGFACDDADALVFALDCIAQKNTSRGGAEGWRSFCPHRAGKNYAYCKTKNREDLLWVNSTHVTYAHYSPQGDMLERRQWRRPEDSRVLSLYPQGIPGPKNLAFVYQGKDVSYKKSADVECAFSTRAEPDGNVLPVQQGETLIACAKTDSKYAVALIEEENRLFVPSLEGNSALFSLDKYENEITVETLGIAPENRQIGMRFIYTPQARMEYYQEEDKMLVLLFPKNSSQFYVFFDGRRRDVPSFAVSAALMPKSAEEAPVLAVRSLEKEIDAFVRQVKPPYLIYYSPEQGKKLYCVNYDKKLPSDFFLSAGFGNLAWNLHMRYSRFFAGTAQNWRMGNLSEEGFVVVAGDAARQDVQKKVNRALSAQLRQNQ